MRGGEIAAVTARAAGLAKRDVSGINEVALASKDSEYKMRELLGSMKHVPPSAEIRRFGTYRPW